MGDHRDHVNHVPPAPRRREAHGSPPRNAQEPAARIDEALRDDILKYLERADFDAGEVSVHVRNGAVSLEGSIDARFQSRLLDLVNSCGGLVVESQLQWR